METDTKNKDNAPSGTTIAIWLVFLVSLALPQASMQFGESPYKSGEASGRMLWVVVLSYLIAKVISHKKSDSFKTRARAIAAAIALAVSIGITYSKWDDYHKMDVAQKDLLSTVENIKNGQPIQLKSNENSSTPVTTIDKRLAFFEDIKKMAAEYAAKTQYNQQLIDSSNIETVIEKNALTSLDGIKSSRQKIDTYRKAILQRQQIFDEYKKKSESYLTTATVDIGVREGAMHGFNEHKAENINNMRDLTDTDLAIAQLLSDTLDVCEKNLGLTTMLDKGIQFKSPKEDAVFRSLMKKLANLSETDEQITARMNSARERQVQSAKNKIENASSGK